jgi:molybdate transport system substrate-binding protein
MATRRLLGALARIYAQQCGQPVAIESVGGVDAQQRVRDGEPFDFVVLARSAIDALAEDGQLDAHGRLDVARSRMALAVRAGSPPPDAHDEAALRAAVLAAGRVAYSTGPSGAHVLRLLARWGIGAQHAVRVVQAPPGVPVTTLVARGDAEVGFQQLSELQDAPGIDIVVPLPEAIDLVTVFSAAVCRAAHRPESALAFLAFLGSATADAEKRRHGLEPMPEPAPRARDAAGQPHVRDTTG